MKENYSYKSKGKQDPRSQTSVLKWSASDLLRLGLNVSIRTVDTVLNLSKGCVRLPVFSKSKLYSRKDGGDIYGGSEHLSQAAASLIPTGKEEYRLLIFLVHSGVSFLPL